MEKKVKNLRVLLLVGIPGSGKSTWANHFVLNNPGWVILNRDSYRKMLKNQYVVEPKMEDLITEMFGSAVISALRFKQNVIIDNTNLKSKYILPIIDMVKEYADVEYQIFDCSVDKAIERDNTREKKVGSEVIKKMYKDYINLLETFNFNKVSKKDRIYIEPIFDPNLPDAYIFDIDGTLAHMSNKRGPFEWHNVDKDDLDIVVARQFNLHMKNGDTILVVSGRDEEARKKTEEWLDFYGLKYNKLLMRPKGDFRKDSIIKEEIYENEIFGKYNVIAIYDDRDQVVSKWRSLGLKVFQVAPGAF